MAMSAEHTSKRCSPSILILNSKWVKILEWDENPQTNEQTLEMSIWSVRVLITMQEYANNNPAL